MSKFEKLYYVQLVAIFFVLISFIGGRIGFVPSTNELIFIVFGFHWNFESLKILFFEKGEK